MAAVEPGAVLAGCLRNATVTAQAAKHLGERIGVVACGERWPENDSLRPCLEDWLGAGAIVHALPGDNKSSEAVAAFLALHDDLVGALMDCPSGQELTAKGYAADVDLAAAHDVADGWR